jgi:antitoxin component YwqK of YwqJK toxin-antitoxin module
MDGSLSAKFFEAFMDDYIVGVDSSGQKLTEGIIRDNKYIGVHKHYYPNGNLMRLLYYKEGKLHGAAMTYYKNGSIASIIHYQDGVKHGPYYRFNNKGWIEEQQEYESGRINGYDFIYSDYDKNVLSAIRYYENGNFVWYKGYKDRKLFIEDIDKNGQIIEKKYNDDGSIQQLIIDGERVKINEEGKPINME